MTQLSILPALDAAGAHPGSGRPQIRHNDWMELWRPGAPIPPGMAPPVPGVDELPWWYFEHEGEADREIAEAIWNAVHAAVPAGIPWPWADIYETHRLPDGALWACMVSATDGGLSHVVLRDGKLEWSDAPGAGPVIWRADTHSWMRLPSKEIWDAEAQAWVPKGSAPKETSAPPDVEATETALAEAEPVAPVPVSPETPPVSGGPAAFLHAIHLATDAGWRALAGSLDRTTPGDVRQAVSRRVLSGDLSLANADALLESVAAAETPPPEEPAPVAEPEPEPPVPPSVAEFLANIERQRELHRAAKGVKFCPLRALIDAGLATQVGRRVVLLPPASDVLEMRHRARPGRIARVEFTLREGADPTSEIVRRVEELARIGVHPDAPLISTRSQARPRAESDDDVVAEGIRHGEQAVPSPSR